MDLKTVAADTEKVPEGWRLVRLRDISSIASGGTPDRSVAQFWDGDIPWITTSEIGDGLINRATQSITAAGLAGSAARVFSPGTLLMALYGQGKTRGKVAQLGIEAATNQACVGISVKAACDRYVLHFLQANYLGIRSLSNIGNQENLTSGIVGSIPVLLPPTEEQERIAQSLDDLDHLLQAISQLAAKKRDLKSAVAHEILSGRTRLPGFHGDWSVTPLGELADIVMGQSPSSANYNTRGDGIPLIQGNADLKSRRTIRRVFTTEITKRGQAGDVILSVRAPVGAVAMTDFDVCLGRGVCAVRSSNHFLFHALVASEPRWSELSKGSTFDSVTGRDVRSFPLASPRDSREQCAIAEVLSTMDAEIEALEARLAKTRDLKTAMAQELLSGRTRLV